MAIELKNVSSVFPRFTTVGDLGSGAFGVVSKVETDDKIFALKESLAPLWLGRSDIEGNCICAEQVEVEINDLLQTKGPHPHLLRCLAYKVEEGAFSILMEYFPGKTLYAAHFAEDNLMPLQRVKQTAYELLSVLQFFKEMGVVHCDLNPNNILIDKTIKVIDFGAGIINGKHRPSKKVNWASYRAPSVFDGPYSHEADTFSAGCVIRALTTGKLKPFPYDENFVDAFLLAQREISQKSSAEQDVMIDRFEKTALTAMHKITLGPPTGRFAAKEEIVSATTKLPNIPGGIGKPITPEEVRDLCRKVRAGEDNTTLFFLSVLTDEMIRWEPSDVEKILQKMKEERIHDSVNPESPRPCKKMRSET